MCITAETTKCPESDCMGGLMRSVGSASDMAERMGRFILECDLCRVRYSVRIPGHPESSS